jgi:hypothetical protein
VRFEWDPEKASHNLKKHGVSFEEAESGKPMKKISDPEPEDDLRPEYDFHSLRVVARGPGRKEPEERTVLLAPDVAEVFPDSNAVNEALRFLMRITRKGVARES